MPAKPYLPRRDVQLPPWFSNLNTKLPTYAATLDLTAADLQQVNDDAITVIVLGATARPELKINIMHVDNPKMNRESKGVKTSPGRSPSVDS